MRSSDPETEHQRLAAAYSNLNDEGLQQLAADPAALTDVARGVLKNEMEQRGLITDVLEPPPAAEDIPVSELVTIRLFRDFPDALIAKSLLEASDIECFLADENKVNVNWLLSNAVGNMKLQVRKEDAEAALEILDHLPLDYADSEG